MLELLDGTSRVPPTTWATSPWWRIPKALSFLPPLPRIGCDVGVADSLRACTRVMLKGRTKVERGHTFSRWRIASSPVSRRERCDEHKGMCSKYGVSGYPTIQWFPKCSLEPKKYETVKANTLLKPLRNMVTLK